MSDLFGIDIQGLVTDTLTGQLVPVTLTRKGEYADGVEYNAVNDRYEDELGDPVAEPADQTFTSEGITPANSRLGSFETILSAIGQTVESERQVLILAKPLGTTPKAGDLLTIDGETLVVTGIPERDPASATWTVKVEL